MFRVGQKVVCVDASPWLNTTHLPCLVKGGVYTVSATCNGQFSLPSVMVDGFPPVFIYARRFRPVVDRPTDISIFTEILDKAGKVVEPA